MGGDDQMLVDSAEQTHVTSAEQENETSNNAQNVEDRSSRSECLQSFSDLVQCKDGNVPEKCVNGRSYLLWKDRYRALNNSGISNFICGRTYICDKYTLPGQEHRVPFRVEYVPARQTLFVKMPVKYVNGSFNARGEFSASSELRPGTTSEAADNENFKTKYENTIHDMWSSESTNLWLYLKIIYSGNEDASCDCHSWSKISPIRVDVSVDDVDKKNGYDSYYSVFYISRACYDVCPERASQYRSYYRTREYDVDGDSIADRCYTDYYRNRTSLNSVIYSKNTYEHDLKTFAHEFGHQIGLGDEYAVDSKNGEYDRILKAYDRSTGKLNTFDLEEWYNRSNQEIPIPLCHNGKYYWVRKNGLKYYLEYVNGKKRNTWLDGTYTRHTQMAVDEFGEEYAHQNATMYDKKENSSPGLENDLMHSGNVFKKHYYIPFKKGMVKAIQNVYKEDTSDDAPNMEDDWEIK